MPLPPKLPRMNDLEGGRDDASHDDGGFKPENGRSHGPDADRQPEASPRDETFAESPRPRPSFKRRHWGKLLILTLVSLPVVVFVVWSAIALNWSYAEGDRPGIVQKVSRKGYICKTWEGMLYTDLNKGFRADSFQFTIRSDSLARVLEKLSGSRVSVQYQQHIHVPSSCFGDTEYFVTGVRELKN